MSSNTYTAKAPINMAVIKYWGKRDEKLILPINDSVSVTLSTNFMFTKTTVMCSKDFTSDRIWLNGTEEDIANPRIQMCLTEIRKRSSRGDLDGLCVHICSKNTFPTAAGLASSASGYAGLVKALAELYGVGGDVSSIARLGSGSACRSMYGGFVRWTAGMNPDGSDSYAQQIVPEDHWPELRALILVVNADKKGTSSTHGMQQSVLTSELLAYRKSQVVPRRVEDIINAIKARDFQKFAEITMKDSNQFHAVCLDTFPPIHYLNESSFKIIRIVHAFNESCKSYKVAYTFDAGPNACLYFLERDMQMILELVLSAFPPIEPGDFIRGFDEPLEITSSVKGQKLLQDSGIVPEPAGLKYIIYSKVGGGAEILKNPEDSLLNEDGVPC